MNKLAIMKKTTNTKQHSKNLLATNVSFGNGQSLRPFSALVAAFTAVLLLFAFAPASSAVDLLGQPYNPAGQTYSIYGVQCIYSAATPQGTTLGAQVSTNEEIDYALGVTLDGPYGPKEDGIGLYKTSKYGPTYSTGLNIVYDAPVFNVGLTLTDFDVDKYSELFLPGKVAPTITLLGAFGSLNFTAAEVKSQMTFAGTSIPAIDPLNPTGPPVTLSYDDIWNVNVGGLLASKGLASTTAISQINLAAALTAPDKNGVIQTMKSSADPYFLVMTPGLNGTVVPEPGSAMLILGAAAGALLITRRRDMM